MASPLTGLANLHYEHPNEENRDEEGSGNDKHGRTPRNHKNKEKNDVGHPSTNDRKRPKGN